MEDNVNPAQSSARLHSQVELEDGWESDQPKEEGDPDIPVSDIFLFEPRFNFGQVSFGRLAVGGNAFGGGPPISDIGFIEVFVFGWIVTF